MATFVLLHGAGGRAADWDLVASRLDQAGHRPLPVDLPCDQEVGLDAYVETVLTAVGDPAARRSDGPLVVVAHSLAGVVAPLVCDRIEVDLLVLVTAMVPRPGEPGGEWWEVTGHAGALAAQGLPDDTPESVFVHDVPADVLAATAPPRDQTGTLFEEPWPLAAWPPVPTRFLLCRDDRFFPRDWMRALVRDRLGLEPTEIPGGHCPYLSQPAALTDALLGCLADHEPTPGA